MTKNINGHKNSDKKQSRLHLVLIGVVLILAFLQIVFANRLITTGEILQKLEQEAQILESENNKIANQIASQGSLQALKEKIDKLGFDKNPSVLHLSTESQVALKF